MKKTCLFFITILCFVFSSAQIKNIHARIEGQGIYTSSGQVPFWMRSNQQGSIPLSGASLSLIASVYKDYDSSKKKLTDWGFSLEGRTNLGHKATATLIEAYGKFRLGIFELKAGRVKEIHGLVDSTLSSGSFTISGNALGIPKVDVSIPNYTYIFGGHLFAFKGNYAHGWIGNVPMHYAWGAPPNFPQVEKAKTYLHQKSLYGRFGRPGWKWKLFGGFNHEVAWGDERKYFGSDWTLSSLKTYVYAVKGGTFKNGSILNSRVGNHLGSIDVGFQYDFPKTSLLLYHQSFYESGALAHLANVLDGLNGVSISNKRASTRSFQWKKMVFEFLYTKNQAGELNSPPDLPSGTEDYYNHTAYKEGWSYKGMGLGTPFISTKTATRSNLPSSPAQYFINNRLILLHTGLEGSVKSWRFITKFSFSKNFGTFATSPIGTRALGGRRDPPQFGVFPPVSQFSSYLEIRKPLKNGYHFGSMAAFDIGDLLYNSAGIGFKLSKEF